MTQRASEILDYESAKRAEADPFFDPDYKDAQWAVNHVVCADCGGQCATDGHSVWCVESGCHKGRWI